MGRANHASRFSRERHFLGVNIASHRYFQIAFRIRFSLYRPLLFCFIRRYIFILGLYIDKRECNPGNQCPFSSISQLCGVSASKFIDQSRLRDWKSRNNFSLYFDFI